MASYRFCRPDDIPLLVEAVNTCYGVHLPGSPRLTIEDFRSLMKELDVWPSNCMVALFGDVPIAILVGTKRQDEVLVHWVGVRSEHQRQGHALHLVTSLGQKLAVLGPPRLIAEPPLDVPGAIELFAAAGFRRELRFTDWNRPEGAPLDKVPDNLTFGVGYEDLEEAGLLAADDDRAWLRSPATLRASASKHRSRAIGTPLGLDAFLLYSDSDEQESLDVLAAGCRESVDPSVYLELLLRDLVIRSHRPVRFPRLREGEFPTDILEKLGFLATRRYERWATTASPG